MIQKKYLITQGKNGASIIKRPKKFAKMILHQSSGMVTWNKIFKETRFKCR